MRPIGHLVWALSAPLPCGAGWPPPGFHEDPDWANRSIGLRRLNTCSPRDPHCTCANENYACYARYNGQCSCWSIAKAQCGQMGGQFCTQPDNCDFKVGGECLTAKAVFDSGTKIHAKRNLVLLGNERVYRALRDGYNGAIPRHEAISLAVRGFLHFYSGDYDGIMVFPHERLSGSQTHGEHWHGHKVFKGRVISMISLQNYGRGLVGPFLHEIMHRWGVFLDFIDGPHWGLTAFDKHGMLGGFGRDGMECASGGRFPNCNGGRVRWDFDAGSAQTSHDGIGKYSKWDLLLMGVMSKGDLSSEPPLVHCQNPSRTWGPGLQTVTCGSLKTKTAEQVLAALNPEVEQLQIRRGRKLRFIALAILPTPGAVEDEKGSGKFRAGSGLEALDEYIEATPARFEDATRGRASLSFTTMGVVDAAPRTAVSAAVSAAALLLGVAGCG